VQLRGHVWQRAGPREPEVGDHYTTIVADQPTMIVAGDGDIRSGLIGNFAVWPFSGLPESGLRPPIVTGTFVDVLSTIKNPNLPTTFGDPFLSGRYNAYGQPCNSTSYIPDWFHSMIEDHVGSEPNALECAAMVTWQHADPLGEQYPFPDSEDPPPSDGAAAPTAFPELKIGRPGHGFSGAIYIAPLARETALRWAESLEGIPTPDGLLQINAVNDLGRALLNAVNIPDGALLRSIQGERWENDPIAVVLKIDRQLSAGRLVSLWFESPDRKTVIPRYLVPGDHIRDDRLSEEARKHADEVADEHYRERFAKTPFGPRLVELRTRRGWSREQLSEASQLDLATIEGIETGEITPDRHMVYTLWRGFGLRFLSELFKDRQQ
jgi:hypothetical protein